MCLIEMNKFFEKHVLPLVSLHALLTMVSLIINIYCIKHLYLSIPMLIRVFQVNLKSIKLSYIKNRYKCVIKLRLFAS